MNSCLGEIVGQMPVSGNYCLSLVGGNLWEKVAERNLDVVKDIIQALLGQMGNFWGNFQGNVWGNFQFNVGGQFSG